MIENLRQETFDILMEIFFENEATDSPKVNEVNQHISRKECLYILRRDMRIKTNYELEEVEMYPIALKEIEGMSDERFEQLKDEILKMEQVDTMNSWKKYKNQIKQTKKPNKNIHKKTSCLNLRTDGCCAR